MYAPLLRLCKRRGLALQPSLPIRCSFHESSPGGIFKWHNGQWFLPDSEAASTSQTRCTKQIQWSGCTMVSNSRGQLFSAKCWSSSDLGIASVQRGHLAKFPLFSHSVTKCSVSPAISTTCVEPYHSDWERRTCKGMDHWSWPVCRKSNVSALDSSSSNASQVPPQWNQHFSHHRKCKYWNNMERWHTGSGATISRVDALIYWLINLKFCSFISLRSFLLGWGNRFGSGFFLLLLLLMEQNQRNSQHQVWTGCERLKKLSSNLPPLRHHD